MRFRRALKEKTYMKFHHILSFGHARSACLHALAAFGGLLLLAGCSDDTISQPEEGGSSFLSQQLHISLNVSTMTDTRSTRADGDNIWTNGDGSATTDGTNKQEVTATDPENQIHDAYICFVEHGDEGPTNLLLVIPTDERYPSAETDVTLKHEVATVRELLDIYGKTVDVYVVANTGYTSLEHNFKTTEATGKNPLNSTFDITGFGAVVGTFGTNGKSLPLVNHDNTITINIGGNANDSQEVKEANLKKLFTRLEGGDLWWDLKDDNTTKLDLERAVARIEYKDLTRNSQSSGSTDSDPGQAVAGEEENEGEENGEGDTGGESGEETVTKDSKDLPKHTYWIGQMGVMIKLHSLQPFNVNTESYLFRHTSAGTDVGANNAAVHALFGNENGGETGEYNWIANPDWKNYSALETAITFPRSFLNGLTVTATNYNIDAAGGCVVTVDELEKATPSRDGYFPFAYVTENTLPSTDLMTAVKQIPNPNGNEPTEVPLMLDYATGIAFKFLVLDNKGEAYTNKTPAIDTPVEFSWSTDDEDKDKFELIITNQETQKWVKAEKVMAGYEQKDENGESVDDTTKPIYNYYLTYVAPIQHNNDPSYTQANPTQTPPMFYGVVRNNSYQLRVNSVIDLPLPQDPRTIFLQIDCNVLPWNVRWDEDVTLY